MCAAWRRALHGAQQLWRTAEWRGELYARREIALLPPRPAAYAAEQLCGFNAWMGTDELSEMLAEDGFLPPGSLRWLLQRSGGGLAALSVQGMPNGGVLCDFDFTEALSAQQWGVLKDVATASAAALTSLRLHLPSVPPSLEWLGRLGRLQCLDLQLLDVPMQRALARVAALPLRQLSIELDVEEGQHHVQAGHPLPPSLERLRLANCCAALPLAMSGLAVLTSLHLEGWGRWGAAAAPCSLRELTVRWWQEPLPASLSVLTGLTALDISDSQLDHDSLQVRGCQCPCCFRHGSTACCVAWLPCPVLPLATRPVSWCRPTAGAGGADPGLERLSAVPFALGSRPWFAELPHLRSLDLRL